MVSYVAMATAEFPAASKETLSYLFLEIAGLAIARDSSPLPRLDMSTYHNVPEDVVPEFVRERLPATSQPTSYNVSATRNSIDDPRGGFMRAGIEITRTALHVSGLAITRWSVSYIVDDLPGTYPTERHVFGDGYTLPPDAEQDPTRPLFSLFERLERQDTMFDSGVPTTEQSGPWPEPGIVVPEAEQLQAMISTLIEPYESMQ
jgi:hypothetical protein